MSEQRLRELERRWQESGALDDHVAWLRERLRLRQVQPSGVLGAAYLGHPAAQALLNESFPGPEQRLPTYSWLEDLARLLPDVPPWNGAVWVRIGLREVQAALAKWRLTDPPPLTEAVEAIEAWLDDPSPEHAARNQALAKEAHDTDDWLAQSAEDLAHGDSEDARALELGVTAVDEHAPLATAVAEVLDLAGSTRLRPRDCARALSNVLEIADPAGLRPFLRDEIAPGLLEPTSATEAEWLWWGDRLVGADEDDILVAKLMVLESLPRYLQAFRDDLQGQLTAGTPLSDGQRKRARKILRDST